MKGVVLFLLCLNAITCANWIVLVAGSNTYGNYRHQSDVFHAYQLVRRFKVPEERIITFAYDDIANNSRNPFPGEVFNKPDGPNVYDGVKIDYFGRDVTPENFVACITGEEDKIKLVDERSTGKILKSTSEDNVFIYFTDHGSVGLIAFPSKYLYAKDQFAALQKMHEKNMYKELVYYLEACESGSMFEPYSDQLAEMNIYTTTAANPRESSWAYYCGSQAKVRGKLIGSCLGDEYSIRFLEDVDDRSFDLAKETMQEQYEYLKGIVTGSHVQQYGKLDMASKSLYEFLKGDTARFLGRVSRMVGKVFRNAEEAEKINVHDHRLAYFKQLADTTNDPQDLMNYYEEVTEQARVSKIFDLFVRSFDLKPMGEKDAIDFDCYKAVVNHYEQKCGMVIDRDFKFMKHFANYCTKGMDSKLAIKALDRLC